MHEVITKNQRNVRKGLDDEAGGVWHYYPKPYIALSYYYTSSRLFRLFSTYCFVFYVSPSFGSLVVLFLVKISEGTPTIIEDYSFLFAFILILGLFMVIDLINSLFFVSMSINHRSFSASLAVALSSFLFSNLDTNILDCLLNLAYIWGGNCRSAFMIF